MSTFQWQGAAPPTLLGDTFTATTRVSVIKPDATLGNYTTWKTVAKVVATTNVVTVGVQTVDGVTLALGDKVLLAGQTSGVNNGLYIVKLNNWEYSGDFPLGQDAAGLTVLINQGTVNADTIFVCTNAIGAGIIGTNSLVFSYMSGLNAVVGPASSVDNSVPVFSGTTGHVLADATNVSISGGVLTAANGLTATTGNIVATAGAVSAGTTVTAGTGISATTGNITAVAGSLISNTANVNSATGCNLGFGTTPVLDLGSLGTTATVNIADAAGSVGFYGVTAVPRPTTAVSPATFVANTSGIADDSATFGGYTIGQIVTALKSLGALT